MAAKAPRRRKGTQAPTIAALGSTLKRTPQMTQEMGLTGTVILSGFILNEEYNQDLNGSKGLDTYDQMRKSDATVAAALKAVKLPILGADWYVEPATESPEDVLIADFVRFALFEENGTSFYELLRQALYMLDYGFYVFELVWKNITFTPVIHTQTIDPVTGKTTTVDTEQAPVVYLGFEKLAPRMPRSIYKWVGTDNKPGVTQRTRDGRIASIPMDKLAVFTHEREGDNFAGVSLLRPAYKHWYMKDTLYRISAMRHERQGLGIPQIHLPAGINDTDRARAEELMRNIRANEASYLDLPEGYTVEFLDMHANTTSNQMEDIQHHDRQIMFAVLAQFLEMGSHSGSGGSRATSSDHQKLFQQSLESVAKNVKETIDKYIIERLVDANFITTKYPQVMFEKIAVYDILSYGQAVAAMATAGVLSPDETLETFTRETFNIPSLPDEPVFSTALSHLSPSQRGIGTNPDEDAEEEKSQNIDDKGNGENDANVRAAEVLRGVHDLKSIIDKNLKLLDAESA